MLFDAQGGGKEVGADNSDLKKDIKIFEEFDKPPYRLLKRALKGYTRSYEFAIVDIVDPLQQLNGTRRQVRTLLRSELKAINGFKFVETLKITFEKPLGNGKTVYKPAYFICKTDTIINEIQIDAALKTSSEQMITKNRRVAV